jgi:Ni,Fe-hydrogenase III small subunit
MYQILKQIIKTGIKTEAAPIPDESMRVMPARLGQQILAIFGRTLCIRFVDAGSCNGCELEIHAVNNPYYNLAGLGIKFVASPRHADMLLVTGPVSRHMKEALLRTYDATPNPKLVVAVGECACNGGIFLPEHTSDSYASCGRVANVIPVDVEIMGCPPAPLQIMQGILTAISAARQPEMSRLK